ncbi:hypothetical protein IE53DRAFT_311455 [Violaceomyces palustris]|uniref:Uncharacterized protein n=1 Tax=Violaceomyces palustris TaxID=1673888 RepID=A0ACD0P422_9BASI|nr:hypothetical protein IE53DRAFT_311455 [Violaceomyces palustris]
MSILIKGLKATELEFKGIKKSDFGNLLKEILPAPEIKERSDDTVCFHLEGYLDKNALNSPQTPSDQDSFATHGDNFESIHDSGFQSDASTSSRSPSGRSQNVKEHFANTKERSERGFVGPKEIREPIFNWEQLCDIIGNGRLKELKRHPLDLEEYVNWRKEISSEYGSVQDYVVNEKLRGWDLNDQATGGNKCFRGDAIKGKDCEILRNDWPYSVPREVEHFVVWSKLPILHPDLIPERFLSGVEKDEVWEYMRGKGLSGTIKRVDNDECKSKIHVCTPQQGDLTAAIKEASKEIVDFSIKYWDLNRCEIAFFANPPSLQSLPQLAHFHVLVYPSTR